MSAPEEFCLSRAIQMFALLLLFYYYYYYDLKNQLQKLSVLCIMEKKYKSGRLHKEWV